MLIKKTLQFLPAQLLGPLAQFASILIWTHIVSASTIGTVTLVAGQQELIRMVLLGWWSHYALRFIGDPKSAASNFASSSNAVLLISALLQVVAACAMLLGVVDANASPALAASVAAFVVLRSTSQHLVNVAAARANALDYNLLSISGPVLGLAAGIAMVRYWGDQPVLLFLGFVCGEGIALIYMLLRYRPNLARWAVDTHLLRDAAKYSLPLLASGVLAWAAANLVRYIIDARLGLAVAGEFAVGFGLGQRAASLAAMLVTAAALPIAIRRMQEAGLTAALQQLSENCFLLLGVMLPGLLGLHMVSSDLIQLVVAPEFRTSTLRILPWALLSGGLFAFIYNYLNHYYLITTHTRYLIVVDGSLALLTLALSLPLIDKFGLEGGVMAMALASGVVVAVFFVYLLRQGLIFPWVHFVKLLIACVAMVVTLKMKPDISNLILNLIVSTLLGVAVYAGVLMSFYWKQLPEVLRRN